MPPSADDVARSGNTVAELFTRARLFERVQFLAQFALHPRQTGAIAPSSSVLARAMVDEMGLEHAEEVVEIGAGTGAFTRVIADRLHNRARFMAMELNPRLATSLERDFGRDVEIVCGSASDLCQHLGEPDGGTTDAVISSLPWASFDGATQNEILLEIYRALRPGGRFCTFAYAHATWLPSGMKFRGKLELLFDQVEITPTVWRNLPPAFVYRCEK